MDELDRGLGNADSDVECLYTLAMLARNSNADAQVVINYAERALALCQSNTQGEREVLRFLILYALTSSGPNVASPYAAQLLVQEEGNPALYYVLASAAWMYGDRASALEWIAIGQRKGIHAPHFQPGTQIQVPPDRKEERIKFIESECLRAKACDNFTAQSPEDGRAYVYDVLAWSLDRTHAQALGDACLVDGPNTDCPGAVSLTAPFGKDRNHISGIGVADLVLIWYARPPQMLVPVVRAYENRLRRYGSTAQGVFWRNQDSADIRFELLVKIIKEDHHSGGVSLADLGCGYGAFWDYIKDMPFMTDSLYTGYDMSAEMVAEATARTTDTRAMFVRQVQVLSIVDYGFASGTFNMHLGADEDAWDTYIRASMELLWKKCRHGLAFNLLSARKREDMEGLYYADPDAYLQFCKDRLSTNVRLIDDYPAPDFTILVWR